MKDNIQLTDDALTNIYIMTPLLNDRQRDAMSYLMYGCYIGEELAKEKTKKEVADSYKEGARENEG